MTNGTDAMYTVICRRKTRRDVGSLAHERRTTTTMPSATTEATLAPTVGHIPASSPALVAAALERFGRIDAAVMFSGRIVTGSFLDSSLDDLRSAVSGCLEAPYHFLRAVAPVMVAQGDGQILVLTSAAGARPTPNAPLYSAARAGATMLVKNVAAETAKHGVQVNAIGTNYMDFPEFRRAAGADDPAVRARIEASVPMRRLGTVEECAAFCMPFIDGSSRFTTGQFVAYAGGWV